MLHSINIAACWLKVNANQVKFINLMAKRYINIVVQGRIDYLLKLTSILLERNKF